MKRPGHDSEHWHRDVAATAGDRRPTDMDFPWTQLQNHTNAYVKKKRKLTQEELDGRLLALIEGHAVKEVAVAACALFISSQRVRRLLTQDLYVGPETFFGLVSYLQAIVAVNHVKPEAANGVEASWARELIILSSGSFSEESLGEHLRRIASQMMTGVTADSLLRNHITMRARTLFQDFAVQLEASIQDNRWLYAHATSSWLSTISVAAGGSSNGVSAIVQLLDNYLPTWQAWASWRPKMSRLRFLAGTTTYQHHLLRDLLAMDGPDFTGNGQNTLGEGLIAQDSESRPHNLNWGNIHIRLEGRIENEARSILDRISKVIEAVHWAGHDFVALIGHFCVGKIISHEVLETLEGVFFISERLTATVLYVITRPHDKIITELMIRQLLPALSHIRARKLREYLAPYLIDCVSNCMDTKRSELRTLLENAKTWDGEVKDIITFAKELRRASWLLPMLDPTLRDYTHFITIGTRLEVIGTMGDLRIYVQKAAHSDGETLAKQIDACCKAWFIPGYNIEAQSVILIRDLVKLWRECGDSIRRDLALRVAQYPSIDPQVRSQRLSQIVVLREDCVDAVLGVLKDCNEKTIGLLARSLATENRSEIVECWRMMLHDGIQKHGDRIVDQALKSLSPAQWLLWLQSIEQVLHDMMEWYSPTLLSLYLHAWARSLRAHLPELQHLEHTLGHTSAIRCLLRGSDPSTNEKLERILALVRTNKGSGRQKAGENIITRLELSGSNACEIEKALSMSSEISESGFRAYMATLEACEQISPQFAEIIATGLLQNPDLDERDRRAIITLARFNGLHLDDDGEAAIESFEVAADYLDEGFEELLAEARRLESLRLSLSAVEPTLVAALLTKLNIETPPGIDDLLASVPPALVNLVDRVGEYEVELHFPFTNLRKLQQLAIAAGEAQSFSVRLNFGASKVLSGFCVHLSGKTVSVPKAHFFWEVNRPNKASNKRYCRSTNRGTYQLSRIIWRHFQKGFVSLEKTYAHIASAINDLASSCIICGVGRSRLHRSTICPRSQCRDLFWKLDPLILLADIWHNPAVVDLMLTIVTATALSGKMEFLPECPINQATTVLSMLAGLPSVDKLAKHLGSCINVHGDDFSFDRSLSAYSSMPAQLVKGLTWACNSYRGFLVTAVDQFRIPSFGPHQFFMANAAPDLEMAFAAHTTAAQAIYRILFHGTSLDRLYAILCQGLKVCSGTPLQRHGRLHGDGVYVADEPYTAWNYATASMSPKTGSGWTSSFRNHRVLLGCELAGEKPGTNGIHVITDPTRLMVRYIFLLAPNATIPQAKDVRPAMRSVLSSLRSGAM